MPGSINEALYLATADLVPQIIEAVADATAKTAQQVLTFAEIMEKGVAGVAGKLEAAHSQLARGAQEATVAAYTEAISVRNTPPYRINPVREANKRYAGGALLSALVDPSFVVATPEEIIFGNVALMNARAKQWHRLNFGAGAAAGQGSRMFNVTWSHLAVASIGFADEEPSAPFRLPKGFWLDGEGGGRSSGQGAEFYPVGEIPDRRMRNDRNRRPDPARNTKGIQAEHFLDAGMGYIAEHLTETYENVYREIYDEAAAQTKGVVPGIVSRTVRPWGRPLSTSVT